MICMCVVTVSIPLKRLLIFTKLHDVTSQKNAALKFTAVGDLKPQSVNY